MSNATVSHKHQAIADHSPGQQGMFFALIGELGYDTEKVKEKAKAKFNVDCFQKLTVGNMMYLIDKLVQKRDERERILAKEEAEAKNRPAQTAT